MELLIAKISKYENQQNEVFLQLIDFHYDRKAHKFGTILVE
jgi:hypothetical protein